MELLYFNGLTNGKTRFREQVAFKYLENHGLHVIHHPVNWRSGEGFHTIFTNALETTSQQLKTGKKLGILGVSAGGSLAMNIFHQLQNEKGLFAINMCGRLASGGPHAKPSLAHAADLGHGRISQSFIDSVVHCEQVALPNIKLENKNRIAVVKQLCDFVVPRSTMGIPGVTEHILPAFGHGMGITLGVVALPGIINEHIKAVQ